VTFGIRKKLQAEHGKAELSSKVDELQKKKTMLKNKETLLKNKKSESDMWLKEQNDIDMQRRKSEIDFLNAEIQRTTTFRDLAQKQVKNNNS
jgi:Axonemal dynein light chain